MLDQQREPTSAVVPVPVPFLVSIGASAGGLDALEKLFDHLPSDSGVAFVVVQHLSPDHKSMMASLLARHTSMPVVVVTEGMILEANQVYLIPPGVTMHTSNGHLHLTPKAARTLTLPIDVFFKSMAEEYGNRSVGVVLSGTGSDGTRGAAFINEAGGFLIAQAPEDAKFDGMPRSVIATGLVDVVLPIEDIGPRLYELIQDNPAARYTSTTMPAASTAGSTNALEGIMQLLLKVGGVDFQEYKPGTVMRRIERRMAVRQTTLLASYEALLQEDRNELHTLRRELLIPVTSFFRDADAFEVVKRQIVEPLVSKKQTGDAIRIWSAAVSTGEEAYSLAMLFMEAFDELKRWPVLKIFATDVEQHNIETAGSGTYPESIAAEVSAQQLERFFIRKGDHFVVKNELRQCIVFARHNILSDPPFTRMDMVVCRNALIYLKSSAQERALKRFQYALVPGGHLFLGSSESLYDLSSDFSPVSARHKIWRVERPLRSPLDATGPGYGSAVSGQVLQRRPLRTKISAVEQGFNSLIKAYAPPPAVLVNARHELVHSYGNVHQFLQLREGIASLDLNRMLPAALQTVATALLFKARREGCSVTSEKLAVQLDDGIEQIQISAWPVDSSDNEQLVLLTFVTLKNYTADALVNTVDVNSETTERLEVLERELAVTRESLQATVEELETSNEELQATNEELMSSNEELQSTNEELQSVNEELISVNAEYQEKIDILNSVNADLDHMAQVVPVGTLFVDGKLHLTRFNPDAARIFKMRAVDIGRPLDDLAHSLVYPELMADLSRTLMDGNKIEREVSNRDGLRYLIQMLPYSVVSSSARGVVISFLDVTALHEASRLQNIIDALAEHIAVLNALGVITMVNSAWRHFAVLNGDSDQKYTGVGVNYLDVCQSANEAAGPNQKLTGKNFADAALRGVRDVLDGRRDRFSLEYPCHAPGQDRWFVMHVCRLGGGQPGAVISHINITEWRAQHAEHTL